MKSIIVFIVLAEFSFAQLDVSFNMYQTQWNEKSLMFIDIKFENTKGFEQILYLQNWRIAMQDSQKIAGAPILSNLVNKLFLIKTENTFEKAFVFEEESDGGLNEKSFKILKQKECFKIHIILVDSVCINNINKRDYNLYYLYSVARKSSIFINSSYESLVTAMQSTDDQVTIVFEKCDTDQKITNYNIIKPLVIRDNEMYQLLHKINIMFTQQIFMIK